MEGRLTKLATRFCIAGSIALLVLGFGSVPMRVAVGVLLVGACLGFVALAFEANGSPVCSTTGNASMSARKAKTGEPLPMRPTTPVLPTPV